jgi:hypothetical protein
MMVVFRKKIDRYSFNLDAVNRQKLEFVRLACYFDFMTIPITYVLDVWRGYEYLYIFRLLMWGHIVDIIMKPPRSKLRGITPSTIYHAASCGELHPERLNSIMITGI